MKSLRFAALTLIMSASWTALHAAPLVWDPAMSLGTTPGGTGNWDTATSEWYNGFNDVAWVNANGDDAYFTNGSGTVTLTTSISAADLYFTNTTGSYVFTNVTGAETLTLTGGVIDTGGSNHVISVPLASSGALYKNGNGQLDLTVDNSAGLSGNVVVNQGILSIDTNNAAGMNAPITVANGSTLAFNAASTTTNGMFLNNSMTISGSGITNNGALESVSDTTTLYGLITLAQNNTLVNAANGSRINFDAENGAMTDGGNNYNLIIGGNGTVALGATSIGGTISVMGPASVQAYLNGITPTVWKSTYVGPGANFYVENNNSFGANANPATLMPTNVLLDGGTITSGGTYNMFANTGITVTTNSGSIIYNSGTVSTGNIYSQGNAPVSFTANGTSIISIGSVSSTASFINLGTGALILNGSASLKLQSGTTDVYSNLVVNGCTFTFNYDVTNLGAVPSTFYNSNIFLNGGQFHVGHSTTLQANRGIYVTSAGTTFNEVTSGGTVTISSTISGPGTVIFSANNYVLGANNSYGNTTINASTVVTVGAGSTTGTLGTGTVTDNGTLAFNRTGTYNSGNVISGTGVVNKNGSGTLVITNGNTYSGTTTVGAGALLVNNASGSGTGTGSVVVNSGVLGGSGIISGPVALTQGTLALSTNTLTINNNLSMGSNVTVTVNKSLTPTSGEAVVSGTITKTNVGTVTVTVSGTPLAMGDTFQLFNKAVTGGGNFTITGGSVLWNNNLALNGTISVAGPYPHPTITTVTLSGTNLVLSGTNGYSGGGYYLVTSTNIQSPLSSWTKILTNTFNASGNFNITNTTTSTNAQRYYAIELQ